MIAPCPNIGQRDLRVRFNVSGIADVNLLRYANVLLLRAKTRAGTTRFQVRR
jgi:hypothetical protein